MPDFDLAVLRAQLDRVLRVAEERGGDRVSCVDEAYWLIETPDMVDLSGPPQPGVGQLSEDIQELLGLSAKADDEIVPWHDLKHLVGLVEAVARRDSP